MTPTPEAQELIRRYLLGQLGDGVREKLEQDLLTSKDLFEELLVVEDELIDEYLSSRLDEEERAACQDCADQKVRASPPQAIPRPVTHRANDRLDEQAGDWPRQPQVRK